VDVPAHGLTSSSLIRLAKACPKLTHVEIRGATRANDSVLYAFFDSCKNLERIEICGADDCPGRFNGWVLKAMALNPRLGKNLGALILTHQPETMDQAARDLYTARKKQLQISIGRVTVMLADEEPVDEQKDGEEDESDDSMEVDCKEAADEE